MNNVYLTNSFFQNKGSLARIREPNINGVFLKLFLDQRPRGELVPLLSTNNEGSVLIL